VCSHCGGAYEPQRAVDEQLPFSAGGDLLQGPDDDRGGDRRLVHHSVIIELKLPSYRASSQEAKQARQPRRAIDRGPGKTSVRKR